MSRALAGLRCLICYAVGWCVVVYAGQFTARASHSGLHVYTCMHLWDFPQSLKAYRTDKLVVPA